MEQIILPTQDIVQTFFKALFGLTHNEAPAEVHLNRAIEIASAGSDSQQRTYWVRTWVWTLLGKKQLCEETDIEPYTLAFRTLVNNLHKRLDDCQLYNRTDPVKYTLVCLRSNDLQLARTGATF